MQRLRLTFGRGEPVKYISHLDLIRLWERALRRASLPLAYSQGFNPRPRFMVASPLPVGVTSEAELIDLYLARRIHPQEVQNRLTPQLPPGIALHRVEEVALDEPSLQSQVRSAEYIVTVETEVPEDEVREAIKELLSASSLPRERLREGKPHFYDLRPLVQRLWLIGCERPYCCIGMRLRAEGGATGRPEEVARALGLHKVRAIHRSAIIFDGA